MKKKLYAMFTIMLLMSVLISGCKKTEAPETETASEPEPETQVAQIVEPVDTHEGEAKSYLTGQWIDAELSTNRPIAVMIENTKVTLPQYNISKADVIYECPVEGGITRLMALYQDYSNMERLGNVRSCRLYYVYFAKEFDAIYVHAGASRYADEILSSSFIDDIDGITSIGNTTFYRTKDRKAPHNFYTSTDGINEAIAALGFETKLDAGYTGHYQFAEDEAPVELTEGTDAAVLSMYYVNAHPWFEYNQTDGLYYRYEFGNPQVDGVDESQIAVKNIIIQECKSSLLDASNGTLDIDCMSGGNGKYLTNGKAIDITWKRESESGPTRYYDLSGNEIRLNQGKTWVCISETASSSKNSIYSSKEEFENN